MTASNQDMQVSVSFGKFENDLLSWERFSSFSANKYLEEVEKCATPGSVAQKKAYFESHYKNMAEKKAEIIVEEEKKLESNASFWSNVQNQGHRDSENVGSMMMKSSACDESSGESTSKLESGIVAEVNETCNHELLEDTINFEECQNSVDAIDDLNSLQLEKLVEISRVEDKPEDISSKDAGKMIETPMKEKKKEKDHNLIKKTDKNSRTNHTRSSPKPNQMNKKPVANKTVTIRKTQPSMTKTKNKSASPLPKSPGLMSTSRSLVKKENVLTLPRKKQIAPKSLQSSNNLNQPVSDPTALATSRKSLIVERMGDKDIVRRVFKTFQKSFDQLGDKDIVTAPKQVPAKATTVSKLATASQKETGRLAKSYGREKNCSNSHRSAYFVPESNGTVKKHKLSRPGARAVERIHLQAKPKAEATNAKTRRQSLDPKAKSMQGPLSKGSSHKVQ